MPTSFFFIKFVCNGSLHFKFIILKRVFISQSNYIPWRGYFDAINLVDEFIVYDDVQYTKNDWRNRNRIKTANGITWLSIPIRIKGRYPQKIKEAEICNPHWAAKHWKALQNNYSRTPYFKEYAPLFEQLYLNKNYQYLTEVNYLFIKLICDILEIKTPINYSTNFDLKGNNKTERLLSLCKSVGATDYHSAPAAKNYLDEQLFKNENIKVHYFNYDNYEPYSQLYGKFFNYLSVLDLIFNEGAASKKYFLSVADKQSDRNLKYKAFIDDVSI